MVQRRESEKKKDARKLEDDLTLTDEMGLLFVWSIHFFGKRLYVHMFAVVDTDFCNGKACIVC